MPIRRQIPKQIAALLQQIEVSIANPPVTSHFRDVYYWLQPYYLTRRQTLIVASALPDAKW